MLMRDVITIVKHLCKQENVKVSDLFCSLIMEDAGIFDYTYDNEQHYKREIDLFKDGLDKDYDILWDMQPTLEEDEEEAMVIQHIRDIIDIILGRGYEN